MGTPEQIVGVVGSGGKEVATDQDTGALLVHVDELVSLVDPATGPVSRGGQSIAATVAHVALGAPCCRVKVWVATGGATVRIVCDNTADTAVTADGNYEAYDDGLVYDESFASPGVTYLHVIGEAAVGTVQWKAW